MAEGRNLRVLYRKFKASAAIIMAAVLSITSAGCYFLPDKERTVLAPALDETEDIPVKTVEVRRGVIEKVVTCSGMFLYNREDVNNLKDSGKAYFRLSGGYIKKMHVSCGDRVKKGDILAELETGDLEQQIAQQKDAVLRAELSLKQLLVQGEAEKSLEELRLQQLKKQYELMKLEDMAEAEKAELEDSIKRQEMKLERLHQLYGSGGSSEGYAVIQAKAGLEAAKLRLKELEERKKDSVLYAPTSGDVIFALGEKDYVKSYDLVVYIADSKDLVFQYIGDRASLFRLEQPAEITVNIRTEQDGKPVYKQLELTGKVIEVPEKAQFIGDNPKQLIRIKVDDLPDSVKPGDTGDATVVVSRAEDALIVPVIALKKVGSDKYVYVLKDGAVEERKVKTGMSNSTELQILEGVEPGEKIVLK